MFALFVEDFLKFFARKLLILWDTPGRESRKIPTFRKNQNWRNQFKILETVNKYVFDHAEFKNVKKSKNCARF